MGVIDLDARVKKLEQEGTGGAVIDQLEAAVTALEGDVEDLQDMDAAVVVGTITLKEGFEADSAAGGCYIVKCGNMVTLHLACHGLSSSALNVISDSIPEAYRPEGAATGAATNSDIDTIGVVDAEPDGKVYAKISSTVLRASITYPINETTPTPTP